jgi:predicted nucleic acid-binding protein
VSAGHLVDANVLIALTHPDHEHHERARAWVTGVDLFAVCPIVEGALVRFLIRTGRTPVTVKALLDALHANPRCEFWTDAVSYRDVDLASPPTARERVALIP